MEFRQSAQIGANSQALISRVQRIPEKRWIIRLLDDDGDLWSKGGKWVFHGSKLVIARNCQGSRMHEVNLSLYLQGANGSCRYLYLYSVRGALCYRKYAGFQRAGFLCVGVETLKVIH